MSQKKSETFLEFIWPLFSISFSSHLIFHLFFFSSNRLKKYISFASFLLKHSNAHKGKIFQRTLFFSAIIFSKIVFSKFKFFVCFFFIDTVDSITPDKVRGLRDMLNSSAMDIMYYTSPLYRDEVSIIIILLHWHFLFSHDSAYIVLWIEILDSMQST